MTDDRDGYQDCISADQRRALIAFAEQVYQQTRQAQSVVDASQRRTKKAGLWSRLCRWVGQLATPDAGPMP